jgi:hypothetical protein
MHAVHSSYVVDTFTRAVFTLATGTGSLQERLHLAFVGGLHTIEDDELPPGCTHTFRQLYLAMTSAAPEHDAGRAHSSVSRMADAEAQVWAWLIVDMTWRVREAAGTSAA